MTSNWNSYGQRKWEVGSGVPVWAEPPSRYEVGGTVVNKLAHGEKLAGATPVEFDVKKKKAKLLKIYKAKEAISGTTLKIYAAWDLAIPNPGEAIMAMPDTIDGTGTAVTVLAVDQTEAESAGVITLTLSATIAGVTADSYLAQAAEAGSGKGLYCQPWTLTIEDTIGDDYNTVGIARGMKYVYENLAPWLPDVIKNNIKYAEWDWFNEVIADGEYADEFDEFMRK